MYDSWSILPQQIPIGWLVMPVKVFISIATSLHMEISSFYIFLYISKTWNLRKKCQISE